MKRRTLLKGGFLLGSLLAGEPLVNPEPAEATGLTVVFFDGTIDGGALENWTLWVAVTGKRAAGLAFNPETVEDDPTGALRLRGRLHQNRLQLTVFNLEDVEETTPVGSLSGRFRPAGAGLIRPGLGPGLLEGTFHLDDLPEGEFFAESVPISAFHTDRFAGVLEAQRLDEFGGVIVTADLHVQRGGAFELRNIQDTEFFPEGLPLQNRVGGFFGVTAEGQLWVVPTRVPFVVGLTDAPPPLEGQARQCCLFCDLVFSVPLEEEPGRIGATPFWAPLPGRAGKRGTLPEW
jgi:hypothetical protein